MPLDQYPLEVLEAALAILLAQREINSRREEE